MTRQQEAKIERQRIAQEIKDRQAAAEARMQAAVDEANKEYCARGNRCHYCGQRATGFGPFDEPACKECGG